MASLLGMVLKQTPTWRASFHPMTTVGVEFRCNFKSKRNLGTWGWCIMERAKVVNLLYLLLIHLTYCTFTYLWALLPVIHASHSCVECISFATYVVEMLSEIRWHLRQKMILKYKLNSSVFVFIFFGKEGWVCECQTFLVSVINR